jgi:maleate isomerase
MRMNEVSKDESASMDGESARCALELSDARVDVMRYACLVAIMSRGLGYHRASQERLARITGNNNVRLLNLEPIVPGAGALLSGAY